MGVPTAITDLSITASSNSPLGSDTVTSGAGPDDYIRALAALIRREQAQGANVASAATVDLGAIADGNYIHITGTTTITSFGTVAAGIERTVVFDGALTLTHNATSLILPGGANISTAAGDVAVFRSEGSGNWRCIHYRNPTASTITNTPAGNISATTVQAAINELDTEKAPLVSPSFTTPALGTPSSGALDNCTANTEAAANNSTQLATTAYADRLTAGTLPGAFTSLSASAKAGVSGGNPTDFIVGQNDLVVGNGVSIRGIQIYTGNVDAGTIAFADGTIGSQQYEGYVQYDHLSNSLKLGAAHTEIAVLSTTGLAVTGTISATTTIKTGGYTVATLPAGTTGDRAYVTDATAPTYLGALTGGGAVVCPVFKNAAAWVSA